MGARFLGWAVQKLSFLVVECQICRVEYVSMQAVWVIIYMMYLFEACQQPFVDICMTDIKQAPHHQSWVGVQVFSDQWPGLTQFLTRVM